MDRRAWFGCESPRLDPYFVPMDRYERFDAWQAGHELVLAVYQRSREWPADERYGLVSQARRAAFSVVANIVEGSARRGATEFRRFLDIAFASLAEVGYCLRLARDLGYDTPEDWARVDALRLRTARTLWALMRGLDRHRTGGSLGPRPPSPA